MLVKQMTSDEEVMSNFTIMKRLRTDLQENTFLSTVRSMEQKYGYRLAAVIDEDEVVCVAGYRISESLAWKQFLYVDDLITSDNVRSNGYGKAMLNWLRDQAEITGCEQFHLDSGVQRFDTHRFYFRERMAITCYHFARSLK
jgi:GNAT superfamily N-acetyltransferase